MSLSEELEKLGELHRRGVLADDEFTRAKARVLSGAGHAHPDPAVNAINAMRRNRDQRWLGGVCGGLAQVTGLATWVWRLTFALLALCGGTGLLVYALLWIFVPEEDARPGEGQFRAG